MKRWIAAFSLISIFGVAGIAAPKGPEVDLVDNRLSINAEGVSIGRLLQLVDMATGMKSKVPPELANRNISVKFAGLALNDAFRKMFQGQPLDYVVVAGRGIIVTASSQTTLHTAALDSTDRAAFCSGFSARGSDSTDSTTAATTAAANGPDTVWRDPKSTGRAAAEYAAEHAGTAELAFP
jgi:hypothetical protein